MGINIIFIGMYLIAVRKMGRSSTKRHTTKKIMTKIGSCNFSEKAEHNVYSNPYNKKPFAISQQKVTDAEMISRRLQFEWFENANLNLRYY